MKYNKPVQNKIIDTIEPIKIMSHGIGFVFNRQDLKPSITPTIGKSPYTNLNFSGIVFAEYTTGAAYINNCMKKPIACLMSRYCIDNAVIHIPMPDAVNAILKISKGI